MTDAFFGLSAEDRREALAVATANSGRPDYLLEKDVWVVWVLRELFASAHAAHFVFKGGTSLSKAYNVIRRFSEDIDVTYDIRRIVPDLVGDRDPPLPPSGKQERKWTSEIRRRLPMFIDDQIVPALKASLTALDIGATAEAAENYQVLVKYPTISDRTDYVQPMIRVEFGARSTGEPSEFRDLVCDAAAHLTGVAFPEARVQAMRPERTFWEKATAAHVFCFQTTFRGGDRFARHWHDLARLDDAGFAASALENTALAASVAEHKTWFFVEKVDGQVIDYHAAVAGHLKLVPDADGRTKLADDYRRMIEAGLFLEDVETFNQLMDRCQSIEERANFR